MSFRHARRLADVRRRLFLEPLENRQLMAIDLEVALRVTAAGQNIEQAGTDISEIDLNGQYQVRGNVRDLRLPQTANSGVFQAYFDVNFGTGAGTAGAATIGGAFGVGQETGTASATSVDLLGGSGNTAATIASQALFLIPFTATTAGIYTFTPELTADQLLFPTALRPLDPVDAAELQVVTDQITVLPLMDAIADPAAVAEDSAATNVNLTGIAGGVGATVAVTADEAIAFDLVDLNVVYTSADPTGTLVITPKQDAFGTTQINVHTTVNGAVRTRTFNFTINAVDDSPEIQLPLGGNTVTFTEAGPAIFVAPAATVVDVDAPANFNNGFLQAAINANGDVADVLTIENQGAGAGQIGLGGGNVSYEGNVIGTFVANALGFDVNFNAAATPVAVQALVRAITFDSPGANPSPLTRNVALTIDDGTPAAATTTNISVQMVVNNDPPTITTGGPVAYTEGAAAIPLDAAATVTDVDSADFDTGTLTVAVVAGAQAEDVLAITNQGNLPGQIGVNGGNVSFGGVQIGTFTGGTNVNPLVVTFNAASSPAAAQALVRAITFFNNSPAPTLAKTVQFDLTDGDNGLDTDDVDINITAVNTAPTIATAANVNYTENAGAVFVDPAATITDADSPDFNTGSLTVSIQTGGEATDFLEINNEGAGVGQIGVNGANVTFGGVNIGTFTGGTNNNPLVITFNSALATPAAAQQLARNITFRSDSDNPPATKTVRFVINDGDLGESQDDTTVTITAVNDDPTIVATPVLLNYSSNSPAAILAGTTTIADIDSADFNTGSLTVSATTGGTANDRIEINNQGVGAGQIGVNGANVTFGGVTIGTFTGGVGLTPLVITFNAAAATPAAAQALAQNITFRTVGAAAAGARTVTFTIDDGDTGTANDTVTVNITLSADPVLNFPGSPATYIENAQAIVLDPTATATDADSADFDTGTLTVEVTTGAEVADTLAVENVGNGAGQIGVNGANVSFGGVVFATFVGGQGAPLVFTFDADATPAIVQELLRHITYSSTSDDPVIAKVITFTLDDGAGGLGLDTLDLNVTPVNDDPTLTPLPLVDAQYTEGGPPALVIPQSTVVDPDSDFTTGSLTVTITTAGEATDELFVLDEGNNPGEIFEVGGNVSFGGLVFATLTGGTNNQPLVITFNANATVPAVQALVRRIAFDSTSANPSTLVRTVTFDLLDGNGGTDSDTADVQVTAVNSPPVITLLPAAAATFTEGAGAIAIAPGTTVTDPDSANFDTGSLTVSIITNADAADQLTVVNQGVGAGQIGVNGTNVTFGGVVIGTLAGNNTATVIVNLNAAATPAAVEALAANITFNNTSNNPSILTRTVQFAVDDGDGDNDVAQKDINVIAINDDPVVTLSPEGVAITGANPSQRIAAAPTVTDTDSPNFAGGTLTVSITANGTADDRLEFAAPVTTNVATVLVNGVDVGTFVGGVGAADLVITFNANATPALVTTLLGNIVYRHNNPVAAEPARTVQVDLTDGGGGVSAPVTKQITILGANQAPVVTVPAAAIAYNENDPETAVFTGTTVTDDNADFAGGFLSVSVFGNSEAADRIAITPNANVTLNGANVLVGGVQVGTLATTAEVTGGNALVINFNASATPARVETLLTAITYENVSDNPSTLARTVRLIIDDGAGASDSGDRTVNVTAVNDDPVISTAAAVAYTEGAAAVIIDAAATVTDVDSPNFDTGALTAAVTAAGDADDRLEIRNEGAGAGQIGVNAANVTFGGVTIGTFTGGTGVTPLVVTFNAQATPTAVQALLRNITYRSVSNVPAAQKTVTFTVTDGDGGTDNDFTVVNITAVNDAPVVTTAATVNYTEGAVAVIIDATAIVTDADSPDFAGGLLTATITTGADADDRLAINNEGTGAGQINTNGSDVRLGTTVIGTFVGGTGVTPLSITLNVNATPAAVQQLLRNITYRSVSENPALAKTVTFSVADGDGDTGTDFTNINVTAVNDNPEITTAANAAYTEGAAAAIIDPTATVTDVDSDFNTGVLTVSISVGNDATDVLAINNQGVGPGEVGVNAANVTFGGVIVATFAGGDGLNSLVITFNAAATPAAVQAVTRNITYRTTSATPPATKTALFVLTDGDGGTDQDDTVITITAVNTNPTLTLSNEVVTYTEGGTAAIIAATSTVTDPDSADFNTGTLTVTVTAGLEGTDLLAVRNEGTNAGQIGVNGTNITFGGTTIGTAAGGNGTPLVITFNASATPAAVQALVRNITFSSTSQNPSAAARTVQFVVTDGDGGTDTETKTVNLTAVNNNPVQTLPGGPVAYAPNAAAVAIDAGATVTDPDSANFDTGSLTVSIPTGGEATDILSIRNEGTTAGLIGVNGANVTFGGTTIGTFTGGDGLNALVITFNANATPAAVQALERSLLFRSTAANPITPKTVRLVLTDGDGGTDTDEKAINTSAGNVPPDQTLPGGPITYVENGPAVAIDAGATVTDPDSPNFDTGTLTVSIPNGNDTTDVLAIRNDGTGVGEIGVNGANVTFGGTTIGTFTGGNGTTALVITFNTNATPAAVQALERALVYSTTSDNPPATKSVRLVLTDGDGGSNTDEKAINITAVNDNPVQTLSTETVSYTGTAIAISATGTVTDIDSANFDTGTLTVSFNAGGTADDRLTINNEGTATGQISIDGTNVRFGNVIIGTFTGGTGTTNLVITFNSSATPAAVQALERQIRFSNVNASAPASNRTVRFVLTDGDGGSDTDDKQISVAASGTPVVTLSTETVTYTENGAAIAIGATSTVTDNNANFNGGNLTVTLTAGGTADDRIGIRNDGTGATQISVDGTNVRFGNVIIGTFTGGTGTTPLVVTFNASATPAAAQALLRAITFSNVSENPSVAARTVSVTVSDGALTSTASTKTVNVTAINDAPVQTLPGNTLAYAPQAAATVIDATATVTDVDSADFATGTLTVSIAVGGESTDMLAIRIEGTATGQINIDGGNVRFGNVIIGTFVGGGGTTPLVITFNASATPAAVQALERNIVFSNSSATPTAAKTARFVLNDGDGGSDTDDKAITIAAAGTPVVTLSTETVTYTENGAGVVIAATSTVTDNNANFNGGNLTVTISSAATADDRLEISNSDQIAVNGNNVTFGGTTIGTFTGGTGTTPLVVTFNASATPAAAQALLRAITFRNVSENPSTTTRVISVTLNDGALTSVAATKNLTVVAENDAPVNTVPSVQSAAINTNVVFNTANNNLISVNDVDVGTAEVQVTLSTTNGTLSLSGITGLTFTSGDGVSDASMTFRGTLANVNAALNGLMFIPTAGFTGDGVITLVTSDQGATGTGGTRTDTDSVTVKVGNANFNGGVFVDINNDGIRNNGELGIPNVTITVTGADANTQGITRTVTTGADGTFSVTGLTPGQYRVVQTQPANFLDGKTTPPTGGTVDANGVLVTVTANQALVGPNFGELGLIPAKITLELFLASTPSDQVVINERAPGGAKALHLAGGAVNGGDLQWLPMSSAQKAVQSVVSNILSSAGRITAAASSAATRTTSATNAASTWNFATRARTATSAPRSVAQLQEALSQIEVRTDDLPGGKLAETVGNVITFDVDAAGQGWFIDPTPNDNEEFFAQYGQLQAAAGSAAAGKVDLLTVAAHEIGHVLGLDDLYAAADDGDIMSDDLVPGVRKELGDDLIQALLGE